jgi:hypothetical protein
MKNKKVEKLRELCNEIHQERREEVETVFKCWLADFIKDNRPWRAVEGNKRCKPIPMHMNFSCGRIRNLRDEKKFYYRYFPDLPDEEIKEIIEGLGFVVYDSRFNPNMGRFCITVPAYEKGKPLTFAQEYVRKINHNYSLYIAGERKKAREIFDKIITELTHMPIEKITRGKDFTLFEGYKYEDEISLECARFYRKLYKKAGMEIYYEDGEYKGIVVKDEYN